MIRCKNNHEFALRVAEIEGGTTVLALIVRDDTAAESEGWRYAKLEDLGQPIALQGLQVALQSTMADKERDSTKEVQVVEKVITVTMVLLPGVATLLMDLYLFGVF